MKPTKTLAALTLVAVCTMTSASLASEQKERQGENLRQKAAELRQQADRMRDEAEEKGRPARAQRSA